jgi:hypothetical protein
MYRRHLPLLTDRAAIEKKRKEAFLLLEDIFTLIEAVPRPQDKKKFKS